MTDKIADTPEGKREGGGGLVFPVVVITTILKSVWSAIKGINDPHAKKSERFWDLVSDDFDKQAKAGENSGAQTHRRTVENTKKYLRKSDTVLDYGCATGTVAFEIMNNVKEVHGIDISSKMIEIAQRKAAECKIGKPDFVQTTIFDNRLKRGSFDVILAFNILHFSEDTPMVMRRIHELLKPGGLFLSATPCQGERNSVLGILLFVVTKTGIIPPMRFYTISELEDFVKGGDFHIVETECLTPTEYFMVAKKKEGF